jgi:rubrerythrin
LDLVKREWEELSIKKGERVTEFNKRFHRLWSKLDPHQPMPAEMLADAYGYKIEKGNQGVFKDLVQYIGMRYSTPTVEPHIEQLAALDTSLNKSQLATASIMNTNTKASARKMESKKGYTTGTTDTAKDNGLICYNCGHAGHISGNCPNCDLMKKLLEQALVNKDVTKAKNGRTHKDKKKGGAPTGRKKSGRLAKEKEVKQEIDSEVESELENHSHCDSEVGKVRGGQ